MNYRTVTTQTFLSREMVNEYPPEEYLRVMFRDMAHQLALKIVEENLGRIDEEYSIERQGKLYQMSIRIAEE